MTNVHRTTTLVGLVAVTALLAFAAGCDTTDGARRTPAAAEGPPAAQETATLQPSATPVPVTGLAATLPIIDLHVHLNGGTDLPVLIQRLDALGVVQAGNGGSDSRAALGAAAQYPERLVAFAGEGEVRRAIRAEGAGAWNLESPAILDYLVQLEADLRDGHFQGIGLLFVNNLVGGGAGREPRSPADSPLMQRLWALSAAYQVPLSVAMNATDESVAEMERLLASDRRGSWLWAGTGTFATPPLVRRLLQTHPNLVCELSARLALRRDESGIPADLRPILDVVNIAGADERLRPDWQALLEEFPDRFVIGTDVPTSALPVAIDVWRHILEGLSPETAAKLAHRNAERLLGQAP